MIDGCRIVWSAFAAGVIVAGGAGSAVGATVSITVDADDDRGTFVAPVGFINGVDHTLHEPDLAMVADLKPTHWKLAKYETYAFVAQLDDVHVNFGVAAHYGWSLGFPNAKPWLDWAGYEDYIRQVVAIARSWFPEQPIDSWNVWPEPDHPYYWTGTYAQLLELYARSHAVLKELEPNTPVSGPGLSCYDPDAPGLENIIDFLVDLDTIYGVRLDIISWHENGSACVNGPKPREVLTNAQAMRADLEAHFGPEYQPQLFIDEYTAGSVHLSPGWNVGYLYYLLEAGIDGAMRACWQECEDDAGAPLAYSGCWAALGGLFMFDDTTPQSAYWVYKAAADMDDDRRLGVTCPPATNAIASRDDGAEQVRVLVGRFGEGSADTTISVTDYPYPYRRARMTISYIPYTWWSCGNGTPFNYPLPGGPVEVYSDTVQVVNDEVSTMLNGLAEGDAYTIVIDAPACPADVNADEDVNTDDFLTVLATWGPCTDPAACDADVNGDNVVNTDDFLAVLSGWGGCG